MTTTATHRKPTTDDIAAMRGWVEDCTWGEEPEEIAELPDEDVVRGVARYYGGGLPQFLADCV